MNQNITNYLKAHRMECELSLVFDEDFVAAIVDREGDPMISHAGATAEAALAGLAEQLAFWSGK